MTETPKKIPGTEVSSSQNVDKSSVDQSEGRIVRVSTPRMKAPPALSREATRTPEDVIIIDSSTGDVVEVEGLCLLLLVSTVVSSPELKAQGELL